MARDYNPSSFYNQNPARPESSDLRSRNLGGSQLIGAGRTLAHNQQYRTPQNYTDYALKSGLVALTYNDGVVGTTELAIKHNLASRPLAHVYLWGSSVYDSSVPILTHLDNLEDAGGQNTRMLPFDQYTLSGTYSLYARTYAEADSENLTIYHEQHTAAGSPSDIIRFYLFFLFDQPPLTRQQYIAGVQS